MFGTTCGQALSNQPVQTLTRQGTVRGVGSVADPATPKEKMTVNIIKIPTQRTGRISLKALTDHRIGAGIIATWPLITEAQREVAARLWDEDAQTGHFATYMDAIDSACGLEQK